MIFAGLIQPKDRDYKLHNGTRKEHLEIRDDDLCYALRTSICPCVVNGGAEEMYRIRKLTEVECMRLMGFKDEDIQKVKDIGMSNTQMYKQSGNGIVTNCVELIFEHLYRSQYNPDYKCFDENFQQPQSI